MGGTNGGSFKGRLEEEGSKFDGLKEVEFNGEKNDHMLGIDHDPKSKLDQRPSKLTFPLDKDK